VKTKAAVKSTAIYAVIVAFLIWTMFPVIWMVISSFKNRIDALTIPPAWIFLPTAENYVKIFTERNFLFYLGNSLVVSVSSMLVSLLFAVPAAYAFARFKFRGKRAMTIWLLAVQLFPALGILIPLFLIMNSLALLDTLLGLMIIYMMFNVPFAIWMMRGFLEGVSPSCEEAAMVDGCSRLGAFTRVTLPMVLPGITATAVFLFIGSWNEFNFAIFFTSTNARTLPTMTVQFLTHLGVKWGEMFAAATTAVIPVIIFSLLVQKYLVRALTFGMIKGKEE
jgi:multiple sugar transport system permease protein